MVTRTVSTPARFADLLGTDVYAFLCSDPGPVEVADFHHDLLTLAEAVSTALSALRREAVRIVDEAVVGA